MGKRGILTSAFVSALLLAACSGESTNKSTSSGSAITDNYKLSNFRFLEFCNENSLASEHEDFSIINEIKQLSEVIQEKPEPPYGVSDDSQGDWSISTEVEHLCVLLGRAQNGWFSGDLTSPDFAAIINTLNRMALSGSNIKCVNLFKALFAQIDENLSAILNSDDCRLLAFSFTASLLGVNLSPSTLVMLLTQDYGASFGINKASSIEITREKLVNSLSKLIEDQFNLHKSFRQLKLLKDDFTYEYFYNEPGDPQGPINSSGIAIDFLLYQASLSEPINPAIYLSYVDSDSIGKIGEAKEVYVKFDDIVLKLSEMKKLLHETKADLTGAIYFYSFKSPNEILAWKSLISPKSIQLSIRGTKGRVDHRATLGEKKSAIRIINSMKFLSLETVDLVGLYSNPKN